MGISWKREDTCIDGDEVFQGFAHLQTFNVEMAGVDEIVDPSFAVVVRLEDEYYRCTP